MVKSTGALLSGVFIGAVSVEIARVIFPKLAKKMDRKTRRIVNKARTTVENGYDSICATLSI